jgi:hypothetical protein
MTLIYYTKYLSNTFNYFRLTSPSVEEIVAADPVQLHQQDLNFQSPPYIPTMSYAVVGNDGKVIFTKPPQDQSKPSFSSSLSPPSPQQDKKSSIGKIVSGDGMLQLRRWVKGVVGGNKDVRRE